MWGPVGVVLAASVCTGTAGSEAARLSTSAAYPPVLTQVLFHDDRVGNGDAHQLAGRSRALGRNPGLRHATHVKALVGDGIPQLAALPPAVVAAVGTEGHEQEQRSTCAEVKAVESSGNSSEHTTRHRMTCAATAGIATTEVACVAISMQCLPMVESGRVRPLSSLTLA